MQRIVICDPSDVTREPLRSLLLGIDFVFLDAECKRYEAFYDIISDSPPDLAVLSLDADTNKSLQVVELLTNSFPQMPVLVISADNQAILQALQRGAKHFLTQPVVLEDLLRVLRRAQADSGVISSGHATGSSLAMRASQSGQVFAVLGSRGGVGCTSLATNLACTLADDPRLSVCLMDLDLALGDCDVALDLIPNATLADLAMNIDKLDLNYIKRSMVKHADTGLNLMAHPIQLSDIGIIQGPHVERIINLLKMSYTHLVVDLSKGLTPIDLTALDMADVILLVAQLELSSLRNVVRMLLTLGNSEGLRDKLRIVINRVGAEHSDDQISLNKAADIIGMPIFWQIPNDAKAMLGSRSAGQPLIKHAPRSKAHQSITGLVGLLTNRQPDPAEKAGSSGGFLKGLFGGKR